MHQTTRKPNTHLLRSQLSRWLSFQLRSSCQSPSAARDKAIAGIILYGPHVESLENGRRAMGVPMKVRELVACISIVLAGSRKEVVFCSEPEPE